MHPPRATTTAAARLHKQRSAAMWRRTAQILLCWGATAAAPLGAQQPPQPIPPARISNDGMEQLIREDQRLLSLMRQERSRELLLLEDTERNILKMQHDIGRLSEELRKIDARVAAVAPQQELLEQLVAQQQDAIRRHAVDMYRLGRSPTLQLLLHQQDPARLSRMLSYYDIFNRARHEKVRNYQDSVAQLSRIRDESRTRARQQTEYHQSLEQQRQALQHGLAKRREAIRQLGKKMSDRTLRLAQLQQDQQHLRRLIGAHTRTRQSSPPSANREFRNARGALPWPVQGVVQHRFHSYRIKPRRWEGEPLRWEGLLIAAPESSEVRAIHGGQVVFADHSGSNGLLLMIDHGGGFTSLYAHNRLILPELGEWVSAGKPVAVTGATGGRKEAALYFEIRQQGKPLDPEKWLAPRGKKRF